MINIAKADMSFNGKVITAVLLDITGVLTESTSDGSRPIEGSVDAVKRIQDAGKLHFCYQMKA